MCSEPSDLCYLQECKICPGNNGITIHVLKLQCIEGSEEITYALWDNGDLIKKTLSIAAFKDELSVWTMKISSHMYVKNIQRKAMKVERENAKVHCLTAKTADRPLTELRTMKQKNKGSKIGIKIKNVKYADKK